MAPDILNSALWGNIRMIRARASALILNKQTNLALDEKAHINTQCDNRALVSDK